MGTRSNLLACLKDFDSNDSTLGIEIKHDASRDLFAFDDRGVGKPHIKSVNLGIVHCFHLASSWTYRQNTNSTISHLARTYPSPISRNTSSVCSPSLGAGWGDAI